MAYLSSVKEMLLKQKQSLKNRKKKNIRIKC